MSDGLLIALTTAIASIISVAFSQFIANFINKKKINAEIDETSSKTNLSQGELIEKYRKIASDQADDNIELSNKIKQQEEEKTQLLTSLKKLREDMIALDNSHKKELEEVKQSIEQERRENLMWRDWAKRLVLQLQSWDLVPVPFDIKEAKEKGMALGDIGQSSTGDYK